MIATPTQTQSPPPHGPPPPPRRLVRYPDDGMVAGVSAGLGAYLGIDPVLVRVGFVLLTITGGVGIPLYLVLWLVVPKADAPAASGAGPQPHPSGQRSSARFWVGLALAAIGAVALADAFDGPGNVLAAMVLIGIGVALFTMEGRGGTRTSAGGTPPPSGPPPADGATATQDAVTDDLSAYRPMAEVSAGGPGDGAAVAGDTDGPASTPPRRGRSILGRLTMAALLLWAGIAMLVDDVTGVDVSAVEGISVALLIVGSALLVGAWFGRARWLVVIGILLLPALGVAALFDDFDLPLRGPVGEASLDAGDDLDYHHLAGEVTVDLRDVELAEGDTLAANLGVTFGELIVRLPDDVRVELWLSVTAGEFEIVDGDDVGGTRIQSALVYNDDADGGTIVINARVGFGAITLRGPASLDARSTSASILEVRS